MDIKKFLKPGKNIVIEIDEVEYLLDGDAVTAIERGDQYIGLRQLYDHQTYIFESKNIEYALDNGGITDYLNQRLKTE